MIPELSPVDLQTIRALLSSKTDDEISAIIELPVSVVLSVISAMEISGDERNEQVNRIIEGRVIAIDKKVMARKKPANISDILKKDKRAAEEKKRVTVEQNRTRELTAWNARRRFKTVAVDLTKLISVRIDSKTHVFVKPGTDIEKIRRQYLKLKTQDGAKFYSYK